MLHQQKLFIVNKEWEGSIYAFLKTLANGKKI
jgi:hypothetical protein